MAATRLAGAREERDLALHAASISSLGETVGPGRQVGLAQLLVDLGKNGRYFINRTDAAPGAEPLPETDREIGAELSPRSLARRKIRGSEAHRGRAPA